MFVSVDALPAVVVTRAQFRRKRIPSFRPDSLAGSSAEVF